MQPSNCNAPEAPEPTAFCRVGPTAAHVVSSLSYIQSPEGSVVSYMYDPPAGVRKENYASDDRLTCIDDRRADAGALSLDVEGFELWDAPTQVRDFANADDIRNRYYAECEELARIATGAGSAHVFDHLVRQREPGRPPLDFGRHGDGSRPGGVGRVHNDYSEQSGWRRAQRVLGGDAVPPRVAVVNIWRSIGGPVLDTPLALCDARTVDARDLVPAEIRYTDRDGEIVLLKHSPRHRWSFFDRMDRPEAVVFKQYDSQLSGTGRFVPHAAFDLPDIPADAPLRRSIEVRCLVVYQ